MFELNEDNFYENVKNAEGVVLVDFYADWCGPCRMLSPIIENLKNVTIFKVNTDENKVVSKGLKISALPTIVFFKDGKEENRSVGLVSAEHLQEMINSLSGE